MVDASYWWPDVEWLSLFRELVIVENIRQVCLLDLTADFRFKINTKLTPNSQLREKSKTGVHSCLYTVTLTQISTLIS